MRKQELAAYRKLLMDRKSRLTGGLNSIVEDVVNDLHPPNEPLEVPSEALDKTLALQATEESLLDAVRDALERIDDGSFGVCVQCGQTIPTDRLQAIPYTRWCMECARKLEAGGAK
jgi:DnaK suppressor protein